MTCYRWCDIPVQFIRTSYHNPDIVRAISDAVTGGARQYHEPEEEDEPTNLAQLSGQSSPRQVILVLFNSL